MENWRSTELFVRWSLSVDENEKMASQFSDEKFRYFYTLWLQSMFNSREFLYFRKIPSWHEDWPSDSANKGKIYFTCARYWWIVATGRAESEINGSIFFFFAFREENFQNQENMAKVNTTFVKVPLSRSIKRTDLILSLSSTQKWN